MKYAIKCLLPALAMIVVCSCKAPSGPSFDPHASPASAPAGGVTNLAAVAPEKQLDAQWLQSPTNLFTLGPGDQLEIEIMGDANSRANAVVGPDGKMYYYLLPGIKVWGLTLGETRELLEKELVKYFQQAPRVSLTLRRVESKRVWLLGRLGKPGIYALGTPMTLLEAISLAGGPGTTAPSGGAGGTQLVSVSTSADEAADLQRSFVLRGGQMLPVDVQRLLRDGDMSQNIYLQADDLVYIPTRLARSVHVLGAVLQPRSVPVGNELSLAAAIAAAGGTLEHAYLTHVAIVRGSLTQPKIAIVDYHALVHGNATGVTLEPDDIVYVPYSPYRTITRYLDLILTTFVRTVGVNEGARAVSRNSAPVGVNVPVTF